MRYFSYTLLAIFLLPLIAIGQTSPSPDQNYVRQIGYQTPLDESQVDAINADNSSVDNDKKIETIVYYDGLGRPKQNVAVRAGGNREDLVTPIEYDALGRQPKDWLPLPELGNDGEFIPIVTTQVLGYYYYAFPESLHPYTNNPYSEKRFEDSPLNRVLEQGAPGEDWRINPEVDTDHTIKFGYEFNSGSEVWNFSVNYENGPDAPEPELNGTYTVNTLSRSVTKDENWQPADGSTGMVLEFSDKQGRTLLKRQTAKDANNQSYNVDTYYIYDDYGNLVYVLSPEGTAQIVSNSALVPGYESILDKLCYQYRYDGRNRLVWKKIPGKGAEKIRYDSLDRPVLTQDANLALSNQWLFTKYDALNRVVYTGIYSPPLGFDVEQDFLQHTAGAVSENRTILPTTIGGKQFYYSNLAYPTALAYMEVLTINYYDDYVDYTVAGGLSLTPPTDVLGTKTTQDLSVTTTTQGLPTVSWVKTLDSGTPGTWTTTVTTYDSRGRALQMDSYNQYLQTRDWNRSKLDPISGRVLEAHASHSKTGQPTRAVHDYFAYDHMGRLLSQKQKIDASPLQLIAENEYDELGRLVVKNVGGETEFDGYTQLTLAEATFDGTLTKTGGDNLWDSGGKTKGKVVGNGGLTFIVPQEDKLLRAGLLRTTTTNDNWTTGYDYGIYFINTDANEDGLKEMKAIVNGSEWATIYEYNEGDTFSITRTGTTVTFKRGSVVFLTVPDQPTAAGLVGKVSFKSPGTQVTGLALFGGNIDKKLQSVDYDYNLRGWLTDINDIEAPAMGTIGNVDLFSFRINYNTLEGNATNAPLYNGNIAQTLWKTVNTDTQVRGYGYTYDDLNRITKAKSYKGTNLGAMAVVIDHDVDNIGFDRNGNILTLKRMGANESTVPAFGIWDNLTYTYVGNKLMKVVDNPSPNTHKIYGFKDGTNTGDDYLYDENGNMVVDNNKGIKSIRYNHLNLPTVVRFEVGNTLTNSISYIYDATGNKLTKITNVNNAAVTTQYDGGYVYSDMGSTGVPTLQFLSNPEGYVKPVSGTFESVDGFDKEGDTPTSSSYKYVFQYKDHLGNVRLSYSDSDLNGAINPTAEIIEESNYYPFGLQQKGYNYNVSPSGNALAQKFGYNGKELEESLGANWLEYGARNFDPSIGRFINIDRYAESFMPISTYQYGANNPISYMDYNGDYITLGINDNDGNQVYSVLYEEGKAYHYTKNKDGSITKGDEYDGDSSFVDNAISDLNKVGSTKQGGRIVGKLQESSDNYNISDSGNALSNNFNYKTNELRYSQDPVGRRDGVTFGKSHIKLGHELAHAYDKDRGFDITSISMGGLPSSEINAVKFENYLRAQDGESTMRLNYTFGGKNYNLQSILGGKTSGYFNSYTAPLGRNEIYKRITPANVFNPNIDNTYVRKPQAYNIYDTKKQKFVSFD